MAQQVWNAGIDVGKTRLDIALWSKPDHRLQVTHDTQGLTQLITWLRDHNVARVGVEASGGYERDVVDALEDAGFSVAILNPRRVRQFAQAKGRLAKNDRIDARTIAEFLAKIADEEPTRRDRSRDPLVAHLTIRHHLVAWISECTSLLEQIREPACAGPCWPATRVRAHLAQQDKAIAARIARHDWAETARRLSTVPGVGPVVAQLIPCCPNSAHSPDAPSPLWSGSRRSMTTAASTPAPEPSTAAAPRFDACSTWPRWSASGTIRCSRPSRRLAGKKPKVIIVACMRKLIVILNAMQRAAQDWSPAAPANTARA